MRGRRYGLIAGALAAVLVLGACNEDRPEPANDVAEEEQENPTVPEPDVCPLTGEDPHNLDTSRPAVAVKIENSPQARPQSGLEEADIVFEEIVEGGITRFLVIFHCHDSRRVGPVRSARFDDPKIAKVFPRVLAFSGANAIVLRELDKQKMISVEELESNEALYRVPPGTLDIHNLFGDTTKLRRHNRVKKTGQPRSGFFQFGRLPRTARRARSVTVNFTESNTIEYRWRKGAWRRYE